MMITKKIAIACDHAAVEMKNNIKTTLESMGANILDFGVNSNDSVDYPDYAQMVSQSIISGESEMGVLICGTGIGISIAANRNKQIRSALCCNELMAEMARQHNDANVIALGSRVLDEETAIACVQKFFTTEFEGGRHQARINKMS